MRRNRLWFLTMVLCAVLLSTMLNLGIALAQETKTTTPLSSLSISPAIVEYRESGYTGAYFRIAMNGRVLQRGTDYSLSFIKDGHETKRISMPGVYDVEIKGMGSYSGQDTVTLTIYKRELILELNDDLTKTEDGRPVSEPEVTSEADFNPNYIRFIWEKQQGVFYKKLGSAPKEVGDYRLRAESDVYDVTSFGAYFAILAKSPIATAGNVGEYATHAPSTESYSTGKATNYATESATIRPSATPQPSISATPIVQLISTATVHTNTSLPDETTKPLPPIEEVGDTDEVGSKKTERHLIPFLNSFEYYRELVLLICLLLLTTLLILVLILIKRRRKMKALRENIHDNMFEGSSTIRKDNGGDLTSEIHQNNGEKTLRIQKSASSQVKTVRIRKQSGKG